MMEARIAFFKKFIQLAHGQSILFPEPAFIFDGKYHPISIAHDKSPQNILKENVFFWLQQLLLFSKVPILKGL